MARDYLIRDAKKYGDVWVLRFQYPPEAMHLTGRRIVIRSMKTPDRELARIRSAPHIAEHKLILVIAKAHREGRVTEVVEQAYKPGETYREASRTIMAARERLLVMEDGEVHEEPNPTKAVNVVTGNDFQAATVTAFETITGRRKSDWIKTWVETNSINKHLEADARRTWAAMLHLTNGKPVEQCTREDGKALVRHLFGRHKGNSRASVDKSIGLLRSACNVCGIEPNPFSKVMPPKPKGRAAIIAARESKRLPLEESEIKLLMAHIDELRDEDQFLFRLLACTGMRLDEAFQIREEIEHEGFRAAWIGTKTDSSDRMIPFPTALLPFFPEKVTGPLFKENSETVGKRLRYWMRKHGISYNTAKKTGDKRKVVHSLRHRVKRLCDTYRIDRDTRHWLLGHERSVDDTYGFHHPLKPILEAIDTFEVLTRAPTA